MRNQNRSSKQSKSTASNEPTGKLLLASLGALSLAQKQSQKAIDTLVAEGESFQQRARKVVKTVNNDARKAVTGVQKQIDGLVNPLRQRAVRNVRQIEAAVNDRVGSVLGRFGVPSKGDVQELLARVNELSKEVKISSRKTAVRV
ncbi:MAG: phasin family protein [Lysobacterales bacterium]